MTKVKVRLIFSRYVLENRERLGLKQQQVADAVSTSLRWIQKIEKGEKLPGFFLAVRLILLLEIDMNAFLAELREGERPEEVREGDPVSRR